MTRRCPTRERLAHYKAGTGPYAKPRPQPFAESRVDAIEALLGWCDKHRAEYMNLRGSSHEGWDAEVRLRDGRVLRVEGTDITAVLQALDVGERT